MKTQKLIGKASPAKSKKKWFFLGLGLIATGALSYFGVNYYKKNKKAKEDETISPVPTPKLKTAIKQKVKPTTKPIGITKPKKAGAKKATNTSTNTETPNSTIDQAKPIIASVLALGIHSAILKNNFSAAWEYLKGIKTVPDYSAVNKVFSGYFTGGVRKTLVSALLSSFRDDKQKQNFRKAFLAIGLKYDGKKWSLSGINDQQLLITNRATQVWKNPKEAVKVPANMVLGKEIAKRGSFTMFESDRQHFLVETKSISNYK